MLHLAVKIVESLAPTTPKTPLTKQQEPNTRLSIVTIKLAMPLVLGNTQLLMKLKNNKLCTDTLMTNGSYNSNPSGVLESNSINARSKYTIMHIKLQLSPVTW